MDDALNLNNFKFATLYFELLLHEDVTLPIGWIKSIRGGFGLSLKFVSCLNRDIKNCEKCSFKRDCFYYNFFESKSHNNTKYNIKDIPKPFNLQYVSKKDEIKKDDILVFKMNIFGDFAEKYGFLVGAFKRFSKFGLFDSRKKFTLNSVYIKKRNKKIEIFKNEIKECNILKKLRIRKINKDNLTIKFHTPVEIVQYGQVLSEFTDINLYLNSILRKYRLLNYFWYNKEIDFPNFNYKESDFQINEIDKNNIEIPRRSLKTGKKMYFKGIVGEIKIKGSIKKINEIYPILKIGEIINIGKHSTFGMGQMKIRS